MTVEEHGTLGMDDLGTPAHVGIDDDTESVYTIDSTHGKIHEDTAYSYWISASGLAASSSYTYLFRTGASESHFRMTGMSTSTDQMWVGLWEGKSASAWQASGGLTASALSFNRNRADNATIANIYWLTTSGDASGDMTNSATRIDRHYIGGSPSGGGSKSGGTAASDEEWVLASNKVYGINIRNYSACAGTCHLRFMHYDVTG